MRRRLPPSAWLGAAAAVALPAIVRLVARRYCRVEVAGDSMSPVLRPGEFVVLRRGPPPRGDAAFGRIVAVRDPAGRLLLKRVVGLPGESVRVGRRVQVNGRVLVEPYAHGDPPPYRYRGLNRLGPDEYFLLGDHRLASTDSRDFGPVRAEHVEGVVVARYWPPSRIGLLRPPSRLLVGELTYAAPATADAPASGSH